MLTIFFSKLFFKHLFLQNCFRKIFYLKIFPSTFYYIFLENLVFQNFFKKVEKNVTKKIWKFFFSKKLQKVISSVKKFLSTFFPWNVFYFRILRKRTLNNMFKKFFRIKSTERKFWRKIFSERILEKKVLRKNCGKKSYCEKVLE